MSDDDHNAEKDTAWTRLWAKLSERPAPRPIKHEESCMGKRDCWCGYQPDMEMRP